LPRFFISRNKTAYLYGKIYAKIEIAYAVLVEDLLPALICRISTINEKNMEK